MNENGIPKGKEKTQTGDTMESLHRYDLSQLNSSSLANQTGGWTCHIVNY
jgi:hypothetical protein